MGFYKDMADPSAKRLLSSKHDGDELDPELQMKRGSARGSFSPRCGLILAAAVNLAIFLVL